MRIAYEIDVGKAGARLDEWNKATPGLGVLALLAESDAGRLPELQQAARQNSLVLLGAIFPELIVDNSFCKQGVLLLGMQQAPRYCLMPCEEAESDAGRMFEQLSPHVGRDGEDALLLLFDGMVPHIASLTDTLYARFADRAHYFGANAGSETFHPLPCLFDHDQCIGNGVLVVVLRRHGGALLKHGYVPATSHYLATSSVGNRICSINWRPGFEVYQELVRNAYGVEITAENFYQYGSHFPFGIMRGNGEVIVRVPVALAEDGSLFCVGEVPPNAMLTLLSGSTVGLAESIIQLGEHVSDQGWFDPLTFYCAGRRMHVGREAAEQELALLAGKAGKINGALSLGEIGNMEIGDYPAFHNGTLLCSEWPYD